MEYCCHFWAGAPKCYLELFDMLQKRICRTVGPSLPASLEHLDHHQNVASLSYFYKNYIGRCPSELAQLVPLPYFRETSTYYSDKLHDVFVTIPTCYKNIYINSFFLHTATLWNSAFRMLSIDLWFTGFTPRINRYFLTESSFFKQISFMT